MTTCIIDTDVDIDPLQDVLSMPIPCGGVEALGIPPCGREATWALDRASMAHCRHRKRDADYKCDECYGMWRRHTRAVLAVFMVLSCTHCGYIADSVDGFAPYVRL